MTHVEFMSLISSMSYKPGYELGCKPNFSNTHLVLSMHYQTKDAVKEEQATVHLERKILPEVLNAMDHLKALQFIKSFIHDVEAHEADEWLKIRGRQIYDPHQGMNGVLI